jgi:predicted nuclease of predicted toxin-antitoxin system
MRILANENLHTEIARGLQEANHEVLFVPDIGLAGHKDREILEYSEKNDLILISGDKDFGGIIEFGALWGRGKVILPRYRLINIQRIVRNILEILDREAETLRKEIKSKGGQTFKIRFIKIYGQR